MELNTPETLGAAYGYPNITHAGEAYQRIFHIDFKPRPIEETVELIKAANMRVVLHSTNNATSPRTGIPAKWVYSLTEKYPDLFIAFSGVDPNKGYAAVKDIDREIREYGFRGIFLMPMISGIPIADRRHYPIYTRACDLGIPVNIAGSVHYNPLFPMDIQHPNELDRVAMNFPDLKIIYRHAVFPWHQEVAAVMMRHPNIYLEISSVRHKYLHPELLDYIASIFKERTVYGLGHMRLTPKQNLEEFMELPLKDETRENILYKTSSKLLGIKND